MSIRIQAIPMAPVVACGTGLTFDFTDQIGPGQQIVCYAVGLSYFQFAYATNSVKMVEEVGQVAINLVPSQANGVIHVVVNLVLTDFDGDGGGEPVDRPGLETCATVTAIVYIDTPPASWPPAVLLGNLWGYASPPTISTYPPGRPVYAFLAGFNLALQNQQSDINGLEVQTSGMADPTTGIVTFSTLAQFGTSPYPPDPYAQTVDIGYFIPPLGESPLYAALGAMASGPETDSGTESFQATLTAPLTLPPTQWISAAAVLLQTVALEMTDDERIAYIAAGITGDWSVDYAKGSINAPVTMSINNGGDTMASGKLVCSFLVTLGGANNLVVNPSFETNSLWPWTPTDASLAGVESHFPHTGQFDAYLHPGASSPVGLQQTLTLEEAGLYVVQAYAATNIPEGVALQVTIGDTSHTLAVSGGQYLPYEFALSVKQAPADLTIQYSAPAIASGGNAWANLDDVTCCKKS